MTRLTERTAANVKRARIAARLTQEGLARKADVAVATVSRLERGATQQPRPVELAKIAAALDTTPDELMGVTGDAADGAPDEADDDEAPDTFRSELARRYGPENAAFVDEVVRVIKDFPAREAAFVRNMLIGAVHGAKSPWRNSNNGARDIGDLVRT